MLKILFKTTVFVVLFFIPQVVFGSVVINEIAWMGATGNQYGEWIELYNTGTEEIDLNNWKLYKDGGDVLIFTLTKKIASGGYLIIERVTDSSPDPLPDINDESGKFGGGGLINLPKGEHLVLKNAEDSVIEDLDFSNSWPAGDNTTKQTMERITAGWQTSLNPGGTPKAPNSSGAIEEPEEQSTEKSETSTASTTNNPPVPDAGNDIIAFIGQEIKFDGTESTDPDNDELAYSWNMGDGKLIEKPNFTYKYLYPGTYLIALMVYDGRNYVTDTITVKIQSAQITINEFMANPSEKDEEAEWIEVFSDSDSITDISGWQMDDNEEGGSSFVFPENTLIAPKSYLVFSRQITGIALNNDKDTVRLLLPEGVVFQEISYEKPPQGKSSARTGEGFVWSAPTPGAINLSIAATTGNKEVVYIGALKVETTKEPSRDIAIEYTAPTQEIEGGYTEITPTGTNTEAKNQLALARESVSKHLSNNLIYVFVIIVLSGLVVGLLLARFRRRKNEFPQI